ncbi:MAG: DUF4093 domain-containing protein [Oscillospiraceae bacterium]|nr:DUF4093 domain-containing protein [Oscillospiraceae bacterium]
MLKLKQALVVEGKYDKNTLSQIVDAPIFVTNGFGIFKDQDMMALLRTVAEQRGLIVLTDADGAGLVIRNRIKSAIAPQYLLHAYTPDVYGKEKRKATPGKEGKLGVEGMDPETLLNALRNAGAEFLEEGSEADRARQPITKTDLYELGLSGRPDSRAKQQALKRRLGLPEHLSANALLTALNCICTREELEGLLWHPESSTSPLPTK